MTIKITRAKQLKNKPTISQLRFGRDFTDHMFMMDYCEEKGWYDPKIVPYGAIPLDPSTCVLHYGQGVFEGLKAYHGKDGEALLFRPDENVKRLNQSCERMCIPELPEDIVMEAIKTLVDMESDWIPTLKGTSLYIRPFVIATDPFLGVHPAATYLFMIILSPVGAYYSTGINPVKIFVEDKYVRAVVGGTGTAKTMGNYAASLYAQQRAEEKGCLQVLWLDGVNRKYIEEVGAMNVFFKINGTIITPELTGSILNGITRKSVIDILKSKNIPVEVRKLSIDEVIKAAKNGQLEECFGAGTAAAISPVGELLYKDVTYTINNNKTGEISLMLYNYLTDLQFGIIEDEFGWSVKI